MSFAAETQVQTPLVAIHFSQSVNDPIGGLASAIEARGDNARPPKFGSAKRFDPQACARRVLEPDEKILNVGPLVALAIECRRLYHGR
jgi:hypothetical protein